MQNVGDLKKKGTQEHARLGGGRIKPCKTRGVKTTKHEKEKSGLSPLPPSDHNKSNLK